MNVLIVSHLFDDVASGPSWSVPAYADSLSELDNVVWIDTTKYEMEHWKKVSSYHKLGKLSNLRLPYIRKHFFNPDIVIFQGFNFFEQPLFAFELRRKKIPYIIVPRGSLAHDAIHNHAHLKKWFAHQLLFNQYVKKASAVQFLTEEERKESGSKWNKKIFVIPNGFSNDNVKEGFSESGIHGVFIGRLDMYHKGIDTLLQAVKSIENDMREACFTIDFYGPKKYDYEKLIKEIEKQGLTDILTVQSAISGEEKSRVLLSSDLFVLTSRFEGHPMGLIEALSYGLPAMVTEGSNMMTRIEQFNAGWSARQNNKETISKTILQIINEKDLLPIKGQGARKLSLEYDWGGLAKSLHFELERIIK